MGLRKGIIVGLAAGSAIAVSLNRSRRAEAPGLALATGEGGPALASSDSAAADAVGGIKAVIEKVKRHAEEALQAAHEARSEEEARLHREFDEAKRKGGSK